LWKIWERKFGSHLPLLYFYTSYQAEASGMCIVSFLQKAVLLKEPFITAFVVWIE